MISQITTLMVSLSTNFVDGMIATKFTAEIETNTSSRHNFRIIDTKIYQLTFHGNS